MKSQTLTMRILIGLAAGILVGLILNLYGGERTNALFTDGLFYVLGQLFFNALKLLVVPVVFVSLVCGTASLEADLKKFTRIGLKTVGLYLSTTVMAISFALLLALLISPGVGFELQTTASFTAQKAPSLSEVIIGFLPSNPIQALADGNMLQIIAFSILLGSSIAMAGESGKSVLALFQDLNEVFMKLVTIIIATAPVGVFSLMARVFGEQGFSAILPLAKYFLVTLLVLITHLFVSYGGLLAILGGLSPGRFFRKYKEVMIFAFSTSSSNATLPVNMNAIEKKVGVKKSIASFTLPLGATINMDGTAIMQGVATVFISQAYGIELGLTQYLVVIGMATLASVGTAGVPGVGLVTLAMVLTQVNLPVEGIGLIIGVDRLLDMTRTVVNVTGDAVVSVIVAKSENQFDRQVFDS